MDESFLASRIPYSDQTITYEALVANTVRDKLPHDPHWELRSAHLRGDIKTYVWKHHGGYRQSGTKPAAG